MLYIPFEYDEPLFRPPSEAESVIFQVTIGCSWNKCAFCEMYSAKQFRVRKLETVEKEIQSYAKLDPDAQKIFLADGDVMVLSTERLIELLKIIRFYFPKVRRISTYASPGNLMKKSEKELDLIHQAGLDLVYIGIESGNEELLERINKGETFETTVKGPIKAQDAGIKTSIMVIIGLGGEKYSEQHAIDSAEAINLIQPDFLSTLILSFPYGVEHYRKRFKGDFVPMDVKELLYEMYFFIEHISENQLKKQIVYRSDHASNYLVLKGFLPRDKERFLRKLVFTINQPENAKLRQEWQRGL